MSPLLRQITERFSCLQQRGPSLSPPEVPSPREFLSLPAELQLQVWETALETWTNPRLACVHVTSAPSHRARQYITQGKTDVNLGWIIENPSCLAQTDYLKSLLETSQRSRLVTLRLMKARGLDGQWLRRLGLSRFHVDPTKDIVFFGGFDSWSTDRAMMSVSLVMGNEFPHIMVRAPYFARYVELDLQSGQIDPVSNSLRIFSSADAAYDRLFQTSQDGLPRPGPPRNMYFLLGPVPGRILGRSSCLHFEDLDIISSDDVDDWVRREFTMGGDEQSHVQSIMDFWDIVQSRQYFAVMIPKIFFAKIKPSVFQEIE